MRTTTLFVFAFIAQAVVAVQPINTTYLGSRGEPIGYSMQYGDQITYLNRYGAPVAYGLSDRSMQQSIDNTPRHSYTAPDTTPIVPDIERMDGME